jgi:hypothetical protein
MGNNIPIITMELDTSGIYPFRDTISCSSSTNKTKKKQAAKQRFDLINE